LGDSDSDDEDRERSSGGSKMPEFFKREFKKRRRVITINIKGGRPSCNGVMSLSKKFGAPKLFTCKLDCVYLTLACA